MQKEIEITIKCGSKEIKRVKHITAIELVKLLENGELDEELKFALWEWLIPRGNMKKEDYISQTRIKIDKLLDKVKCKSK